MRHPTGQELMVDGRKWVSLMFFRDTGFYIIPCPMREGQSPAEVARENAECNPGTLRVEDLTGVVLWQREAN